MIRYIKPLSRGLTILILPESSSTVIVVGASELCLLLPNVTFLPPESTVTVLPVLFRAEPFDAP